MSIGERLDERMSREKLESALAWMQGEKRPNGRRVTRGDMAKMLQELKTLRSLFTPETVAALEVGADFLQLQADRLSVLGTASIRSKQAAALRALASAAASTADGAANE